MAKHYDSHGNEYYKENNVYFVVLAATGKKKRIGVLDPETATLYVKRTKAKHLHKKTMSYGFADYLIENTKKFDKIHLRDDDGEYLIPVDAIREEGKYLYFKYQGFELQKFLPLSVIRQYKISKRTTKKEAI